MSTKDLSTKSGNAILNSFKQTMNKLNIFHLSGLSFFGFDAFTLSKHIEECRSNESSSDYSFDLNTENEPIGKNMPDQSMQVLHELSDALKKKGCKILCPPTAEQMWRWFKIKFICALIVMVAVSVLVLSAKNNSRDFWNTRTIISTISLLFILPGLWDFMKTSFEYLRMNPTILGLPLGENINGTSPAAIKLIQFTKDNAINIAFASMVLALFIACIVVLVLMSKKAQCPKPPACPDPSSE